MLLCGVCPRTPVIRVTERVAQIEAGHFAEGPRALFAFRACLDTCYMYMSRKTSLRE
jgi:hypothetical protein